MRPVGSGGPHLTYCTNIHAGESWKEVRDNLERYTLAVKSRVSNDQPFGIGLRLSGRAALELADRREMEAFREFLQTNGLYVFTLNGFPHGEFHTGRVKENAYLPDWLDEARLEYTDLLAGLLAELLPVEDELEGSISTVPAAFRARVRSGADAEAIAFRILRHAATLHAIRERTGQIISLALEPEPCCLLETTREAVDFFERYLLSSAALDRFGGLAGLSRGGSEAFLRRHLGVCFDACHIAVQFEEPRAALDTLDAAGIRIGKLQISAGLVTTFEGGPTKDGDRLQALRAFADETYLHQVVERRRDGLRRYLDLPEALAAGARETDAGPREWRIHFHVPICSERLGPFESTRDFLRGLFRELRGNSPCRHLEVETYTWDVLPEEYRREGIVTSVARELSWVKRELIVEDVEA